MTTPRSARLAQRHGAGLEARLTQLHATYDARGLAWADATTPDLDEEHDYRLDDRTEAA